MPTLYLRVEYDHIDPRQSVAPRTPLTLQEAVDAFGSDMDAVVVDPPVKSSYVAVLGQSGGCDYTIECGTKVEDLSAKSLDEAIAEVTEMLEEEYSSRETRLSTLTIHEVSRSRVINLKTAYAAIRDREKAAAAAEQEEREREQLATLQKKYGRP